MGDSHHRFRSHPANAVVPLSVAVGLGVTTEAHQAVFVGINQLPGPAAFEPLITDFHLPALADLLIKDAKLVADPVASGRHLQAGQGIEEAGSQPP
jgi:hypothetical protein